VNELSGFPYEGEAMNKVEKHLTAAESSELELLRRLLGEKADVDARNEYGQTPLSRAAAVPPWSRS
jgi:hypothetical protein